MAGRNSTRNILYEKYKAQGLSDEDALNKADKESQIKSPEQPEETWVQKLKRKIKGYFSGKAKEASYNDLLRQGYTPRDIIRLRNPEKEKTFDEAMAALKAKGKRR